MKEVSFDALLEALGSSLTLLGDHSVAPVVCFDADHTLWASDLADLAFWWALKERRFRPEAGPPLAAYCRKNSLEPSGEPHEDARALYEQYKRDGVSEEDIVAAMVVCFAGWNVAELAQLGRELTRTELNATRYAEVDRLVLAVRALNLEIRVISGTAEWLVSAGVEALGISAGHVRGARTDLDANGFLLPNIRPPLTFMKGKLEAIRGWFQERRALVTFGDSENDLAMLEGSTVSVLVNPRPGLRSKAAAKTTGNWLLWTPKSTRDGRPVLPITSDRIIA